MLVLLSPLSPEQFGPDITTVKQMVTIIENYGGKCILSSNSDGELFFFLQAELQLMEDICSTYNLDGVAVNIDGIFDQKITLEAT
jgi:hypothetical protein